MEPVDGGQSAVEPSEATLISRALALRDTAAFTELLRRHEARIRLLERRLCGDASLADDLTQETFLRAWQKLHTFAGAGSFGAWLARIGYRVFLDQHRLRSRERHDVSLDTVTGTVEAAGTVGMTDPAATTACFVTATEPELMDLDRLLAVVAHTDQVLLTLCYACGLSNAEAGRVLGMPAGTVKARIHRAKQRIREHFDLPRSTVDDLHANGRTAVASDPRGDHDE